jgi:site-specific DNA-cytosine methylase
MKDAIAEISVKGRTPEEYKQNFIKHVLRPKRYRPITVREATRLQGLPECFKLHDNPVVSFQLIGNSVAVPVVEAVAGAVLHTGALSYHQELRLVKKVALIQIE